MASQADAIRAAMGDATAPRPAVAGAIKPAAGARQYEGRRALGNGSRIKLDRIIPDPGQPRKTFGTEADDRLAESMRVRGQLVPILVRWSAEADRYVVIDGERRYRAATVAGLAEMACVVEDEADPDAILELQLITNALREDVAPVEQARAWDQLRRSQGLTLRQLADKLGYDHSTVGQNLDLLKLAPELQGRVDAGELPASTAGQLVKLEHSEQVAIADRVAAEGLNRAEAREAAREVAARKPKGQGGSVRAKGKGPKVATSRVYRGPAGLRIEATRAKGIDPAALAESLRAFLAEVERDAVA